MSNSTLETTLVPYSKLVPSKLNARKSGGDDGIDELAALIRAKGLIQPLVVRPSKRNDKLEIIAGARRHKAIGRLIKMGDWPKEQDIPVIVRLETDSEARETSAIENIGRSPMHPVDEFEHFAQLAAEGHSNAAIAQRYGIQERRVRQRLALGTLAPEIRQAWREAKIDAAAAQAFTLTTDTKEQGRLLERLQEGLGRVDQYSVRRELTQGRIKTNDGRFQLVGREAYEAAGGEITEDLFAAHSYINHPQLLDQLVERHLAEACEHLISEGWGWAEVSDKLPRDWQGWSRLREPQPDLTTAESKRLDEIEARIKAIEDPDREDLTTAEEDEEVERLQQELQEIENRGLERAYTVKDKKRAGCVVSLDYGNKLEITFGVKRPATKGDDEADEQVDLEDSIAKAGKHVEAEPKGPFDLSAPVLEAVSRARTAAAAKVLENELDLALRFVVAALGAHSPKPVDISAGAQGHGRSQLCDGDWKKRLARATKLDRETLLGELARLVSLSLDLVEQRRPSYMEQSAGDAGVVALLPGAEYLEAARAEFAASDYFARCSRPTSDAALKEMQDAGVLNDGDLPAPGARKADAAAVAAEQAAAHGWLPPEMRHPDYAIGAVKPKAKAKRGARVHEAEHA
jgi:ParB family chromosome partitioning protein